MNSIRPARRYPRITAVVRAPHAIALATVDPWEVRTARRVPLPRPPAATLAMTALLTRERPSFLVVPPGRRSGAERLAVVVAKERGLAVLPAPPMDVLREVEAKLAVLVPEVAVVALPKPVRAALALAMATLHALPLRSSRSTAHAHPRQ